jgi:ADP-ribose pyrophosphatase YjhB (NUDIX family)
MTKTCIVASAVILEENMVILHRNDILKKWMLPGGHFLNEETPENAIKRIVEEMTGENIELIDYTNRKKDEDMPLNLSLNPITILVENIAYEDGKHNHIDIVFIAKLKNKSKSLIHSQKDVRLFPISEMRGNEIDSKVVEVIERASSYL